MATEIETKLKVDSLDEVAERLSAVGAEFLEEQHHKDDYFDSTNAAFKQSDKCLRLRRQLSAGGEKLFLCYKGPREESQLKKREELELVLEDIETAEQILLALGYHKALTIEKRRRVWRLNNCVVGLDELPELGNFVEIEGPCVKEITEVKERLNLMALPDITESYACLIEEAE